MDFFSTFVALRYIRAHRKNRFFSWIAALSVVGVTISVAAMIVVLSVIDGFEVELRKRFLAANAHVLLFRYPNGMTAPDEWAKTIQKDYKDKVIGVSPFVHHETMVKSGSIMNSVLIRGISPKARESVQSIRSMIHPAEALDILQQEIDDHAIGKPIPKVPAIIVGTGLLRIINAKVGDQISVVSPNSQKTTDLKTFRVVGIYDSGLKHYDNKLAAMSLSAAQDFFQMGDRVTGVEVGLSDADASPAIAEDMENRYSFSVREWQSFNAPLFKAMEQEKWVIALIVWLIAIVAGFNILMTILVAVTQKQHEISILKSLGASNMQIIAIFLKQGVYIGIIGSILGTGFGAAISWALAHYQFVELPDPYFLSSLPVTYNLQTYIGAPVAALILCIVSGIYPSLIAARVAPTEGIRGTGRGAH